MLADAIARRLPGIRVDVAPPPAVDALPRMDVAVFVGFASTGPLHLPVAIESAAQYAAVFGPDAPLAWDAQRGERVLAHLGCAVRAFFANGGRRCWVQRIARSEALEVARGADPSLPGVARSSRFAVPGVLALPVGGAAVSALSGTRCEGSWADPLRLSCAALVRGLAIEGLVEASSPPGDGLVFRSRVALRVGDLLQLGDRDRVCAYARVEAVDRGQGGDSLQLVEARMLAAFERASGLLSPGLPGSAEVRGFGAAVSATWLGADAEHDDVAALQFDDPLPALLEAGHWARFESAAGVLWQRIDSIHREASFAGSPPSMATALMTATTFGPAWQELGAVLPPELGGSTQAQRVELELRTSADAEVTRRSGIGLAPAHPASFWTLQDDAAFYRPRDDRPPQPPGELPRFALAPLPEDQTLAWLPLGVEPLHGAALAPLPQDETALERDGLSRFDASLFVDPELVNDGVATVVAHADDIRLIRPNPRELLGLHAALAIGAGGLFNEASLLALPDAIHLGWQRRVDVPPEPSQPEGPDALPFWGSHAGPCATQSSAPEGGPDFASFLDCSTRLLAAPWLSGPDAPLPPGPYRLSWSDSEPGATYVLLEATAADFSDAREVYRGLGLEHRMVAMREGVLRYQVFAWLDGQRSLGSNPVTVVVRGEDWEQLAPDAAQLVHEADWLAVQRAALRLANACGDLFVALAMPRHFRTPQALLYTARLRAVRRPPAQGDPHAFGYDEARALSHGAMYFPWVQSALRDGLLPAAPRVVPPDGLAMGVLAARASQRGAWIAPANQALRDVVALAPPVRSIDRQALQDAQINLLRDDPRGFLTLSADTLAHDTELRPIQVRRLLALLRRLALRRGTAWVFEPNGPALRRSIKRGFDILMGDLFRRGAFAGATPSQSFRVVTDETVNTPREADAGRLVVELHVAPAQAMRFIAVRLLQSGERLSVAEEL
ncbi:phage tail sheath C-terminal domain-containing protein [Roseateles sp. P5_D6]